MRAIFLATLLLACASHRNAVLREGDSARPKEGLVRSAMMAEPEAADGAAGEVAIEPMDERNDGPKDKRGRDAARHSDLCPVPEGWVRTEIFHHSRVAKFAAHSAALTVDALRAIRAMVADYNLGDRGMFLRILGYRDRGEDESLGLKRADAVWKAMVELGVPEGCLSVVDGGADVPIDKPGAALNSRVEVQTELRRDGGELSSPQGLSTGAEAASSGSSGAT